MSGVFATVRGLIGLFWRGWKARWLTLFVPPWRNADLPRGVDGPIVSAPDHWIYWIVGWAWTIAGLFLGASLAPSLEPLAGSLASAHEEEFGIGAAFIVGFLIQLVGYLSLGIPGAIFTLAAISRSREGMSPKDALQNLYGSYNTGTRCLITASTILLSLLPLALAGYLLSRYLLWVGEGQRVVVLAFAATLLVKTFILAPAWSFIQSAAFKRVLRWLRGDRKKSA